MKLNGACKYSIVVATAMVFAFFFSMLTTPVRVQGDSTDEIQITAAVHDYFKMLYEARRTSQPSDFSKTATITNSINPGWLAREQERQEIERVISQTFNETILDYTFQLDYKSLEVNNNKAVIALYESNSIWYSTHPDVPSQMANLQHLLTLTKINNNWVINNDEYDDDITRLIASLSKEEILTNIHKNHDGPYTKPSIVPPISTAQPSPNLSSYTYNGTAAKSYADT